MGCPTGCGVVTRERSRTTEAKRPSRGSAPILGALAHSPLHTMGRDRSSGRNPRPPHRRRHDLYLRHRHVRGLVLQLHHYVRTSPAPGPYNLGSMANAMPQVLGARALDRDRQVVAVGGDGGLMMLLGDLRTAVSVSLPITLVVFDDGRRGMVKLEQEEVGTPKFGTALDNPDHAALAHAMGSPPVESPTRMISTLH